jgi:hypothetical protein
MIRFLLLAASVALPIIATGEPPPTPVATSTADPSALVRASRETKAHPRKPAHHTITNASLHKTRSEAHAKSTGYPAKSPAPRPAPRTVSEDADARYRQRIAAEEQVHRAEGEVKALEGELNRTEQNYYDETNFDYRDTVLQQRFTKTQQQLAGARRALDEAREALTAANAKP